MDCDGILLTGGASRRLGRDKATLTLDGDVALARRAATVLAGVCDRVVEVGSGASGLPSVREDPPGAGPLAALVAGYDHLGGPPAVLLLACDLPEIESPLLRLLVEWPGCATVIPVAGTRLQYACARYGSDALEVARSALAHGELSLQRAAGAGFDVLPETVWSAVATRHAFDDIDTPADLRALEARRLEARRLEARRAGGSEASEARRDT